MEPTNSILKINNIEVKYHEVILVIKGVSIEVPEGGIVALLGANGAGKSTILKAISGLLMGEEGKVIQGSITYAGERIDRLPPEEIVRQALAWRLIDCSFGLIGVLPLWYYVRLTRRMAAQR
mgnify:CR=1 FL=1